MLGLLVVELVAEILTVLRMRSMTMLRMKTVV